MGMVRVLKCIPKNRGNDYNDYKYPKWCGKPIEIECEDWDTKPMCGGGFHGITKDNNAYNIFNHGPIYQVMEVDDNPDNFVKLWDKIKFNKGTIIYQGNDAYKALRMIFDSDKEMFNWGQFSLKYIKPKNKTEELQLLAVKNCGLALQYCHNPSYKVMYEAVKQNGYAIQFIKSIDQTEELQLLSVKNYGLALQYCHNPSDKVIYKAVKKNANAIEYIPKENQTEELQLLAVKQNPYALQYCHNPSNYLIIEAVKTKPEVLIHNKTILNLFKRINLER